MKNLTSLRLRKPAGVTILELLVTVGIIGVVASILLPSIPSLMGESKEARNRRNAQNIVSLYNNARCSGATAIDTSSKDSIIAALMDGISVNDPASAFNGRRFSIGSMEASVIADVKPYIRLSGDLLDYMAEGEP